MKSVRDKQEIKQQQLNNYTMYKHTSPSGKVYIGITKMTPKKRWNNGKGYINSRQILFERAILKYGWDNIKHEILLSNISKEEAKYAERYLIRWYKIHNISYNITDGGDSVSERVCRYGKDNPMYGRHETNPMYGIRGEGNPNSIRVFQYDREGNFIKEWGSIIDASKELNISQTGISYCCKGKIPASGNFIWRYYYKERLRTSAPSRIKEIYQYNVEGTLINHFNKIRDAIKFLGLSYNRGGVISNCCNGKAKSALGYFWSCHKYDKYPIPDNPQIITKMIKLLNN